MTKQELITAFLQYNASYSFEAGSGEFKQEYQYTRMPNSINHAFTKSLLEVGCK